MADVADLPQMPKVTLGRTGIVTTPLGLGLAGWPHEVPFETLVQVVRTAFDVGIRHIDAAPKYGSEEMLGQALKEVNVPQDMVMATKICGYYDREIGIQYYGYRPDNVYRSAERSLKRLGVDRLDIVHLHDTRKEHLPQIFGKSGAITALQDLKDQGVIRAIGMGTMAPDCLEAALDTGQIDVIQIFHVYTLLDRSAAHGLIPKARALGAPVFNAGPYAGYILATGAVEGAKYNYAPALPHVTEAVRRMEAMCARRGVTIAQAALAFSLRSPDIAVTVVGSGKPHRVAGWVSELASPLTDADFAELLAAAGDVGPLPHL